MDKDKSIGVFVAILPLNVVLHQSVWISMHGFSQNWTYQKNIFPSSFGRYANRFCEKKYIFENLLWNMCQQPEKLTKFNQHEIWDKQMQGRFCIKSFFFHNTTDPNSIWSNILEESFCNINYGLSIITSKSLSKHLSNQNKHLRFCCLQDKTRI